MNIEWILTQSCVCEHPSELHISLYNFERVCVCVEMAMASYHFTVFDSSFMCVNDNKKVSIMRRKHNKKNVFEK